MAFIQNPTGKIKQSPEFRILAYPQSAIGMVDAGGFGLVDVDWERRDALAWLRLALVRKKYF